MLDILLWIPAFLIMGIWIGVIIMNNREALDSLREEVAQSSAVVTSAITLIQGLRDQLTAALQGDDLVGDITSLRDTLDADQTRFATAVAANTRNNDEVPPAEPVDTGSESVETDTNLNAGEPGPEVESDSSGGFGDAGAETGDGSEDAVAGEAESEDAGEAEVEEGNSDEEESDSTDSTGSEEDESNQS